MTVWFTGDTHFWHKSVIGYCNRPWPDVEQMNEGLIRRWNEHILEDDMVYHLGDFAFCGTTKCADIFGKLKGRKFLIRGNHDGQSQCKPGWEWVKDYYSLRVQLTYQDDDGEEKQYVQPIILMHFPILSWDGMAHGSWHLHGHCHGSLPDTGVMRLDVGVDCNNWYPCSLDDIRKKMIMRSIIPVDHHKVKEIK